MKHVLILGIDTFAAKNVAQVQALSRMQYRFTIATIDSRADSHQHFDELDAGLHRYCVLAASPFKRLRQVWRLLKQGPYNHVELYAGGRFTLLYLPLLRCFDYSWIVVERGDIGSLAMHAYLTRVLVKKAYRTANAVWYKEPYMLPLLITAGARKLYFIPNAAQVPGSPDAAERRDIDFLWANRLVRPRHPEWIVRAMADHRLADCSAVMLGMQEEGQCDRPTRAMQRYVREHQPPGVTLHAFSDPMPWYGRARYFVLPASIVFGNNALLEAMARGVVPIVTRSPGIEGLIVDGVNGFIAELDENAFTQAMLRAAQLDPDRWRIMSDAAVQTIHSKFSLDLWRQRMCRMYEELA